MISIFRFKGFRFEIKKTRGKKGYYIATLKNKWIADCTDIDVLKGFLRQYVNGVKKHEIKSM